MYYMLFCLSELIMFDPSFFLIGMNLPLIWIYAK